VIRPDSGDPVNILCGDPGGAEGSPARRGVIGLLWDTFGGTVNDQGFKELDSHIGAIYGDSITEERADQICRRLAQAQFASTNVVLGIGSYTYQYVTRDTYGLAMKATWAQINGTERMLYKDPVTDNGVKRSARGRIVLAHNPHLSNAGVIQMTDGLTFVEEQEMAEINLLKPIWQDGQFLYCHTLTEIRERLHGSES
jgi:nicotinamide phosphoribosyltransferase